MILKTFRYIITKILITLLLPIAIQAKATPPTIFIQNYGIKDYKASCQTWSIAISPDGYLFVGSNSGILIFDGNNWEHYILPNKAAATNVTYFNDKIYVKSSSLSVGKIEKNEMNQFVYKESITEPENLSFTKRNRNYYLPDSILSKEPTHFASIGIYNLTGTKSDGIYMTNAEGETIHHINKEKMLIDDHIKDICIQDETQFWVATDNGISCITINPSIQMLAKRSDYGRLIEATLKDKNLYIKTSYGFFKKDIENSSNFIPITSEEGNANIIDQMLYPSNLQFNDIFQDSTNIENFSKSKDIYSVGNNLHWLVVGNDAALYENKKNNSSLKCRIKFDNYDLNFSTQGPKILPINKYYYLGSMMQGTILIDTKKLIQTNIDGKSYLKINSIKYNDPKGEHQINPNNEQIELPHNFIQLKVKAGTSIFTHNHQISYKLEGISDEWSEWQNNGEITFFQLPKGDYKLKIRKYIVRGPYPETSLNIHVAAPWYASALAWFFYISIAYISLVYILHAYYHKKRNIEKQQLAKKQKEEEAKLQRIKNEILERELARKKDELLNQTSSMARKKEGLQALMEEIEKQKEFLGDRYPNKLYNKIHTMLAEMLNDEESWSQFETYFNEAHRDFINRLKQQYPEITHGDIRICCLLRMNISTKEIASLLNVTVRAVELRRYRLRKRLLLQNSTNLVDFLMQF